MHGAGAVVVVAKGLERQRSEMRLYRGERGGDLTLGGAVDTGIGPARLPAVEIRLRLFETLEAQPLERRALGVADRRLDFPLPIRGADTTGQRDDAVVREHIAVERVEGRIVDVGREHAFLEIVEVMCRPSLCGAGLPFVGNRGGSR